MHTTHTCSEIRFKDPLGLSQCLCLHHVLLDLPVLTHRSLLNGMISVPRMESSDRPSAMQKGWVGGWFTSLESCCLVSRTQSGEAGVSIGPQTLVKAAQVPAGAGLLLNTLAACFS